MPAIANITVNVADIYEPVSSGSWIDYGVTSELNATLKHNASVSNSGVQIVTVDTKTPLLRTVDGASVADGFDSGSTRFTFAKNATQAEREADIQRLADFLSNEKATLAAGKLYY